MTKFCALKALDCAIQPHIGVLYLEQPRNTKPEFAQAWYNQSSTSKMLSNGTRTDCSDAKDATGRYVWREDGEKDGRCFGLDFQEARQQNCRTDKSKTNDEVCVSTRISQYVPYAYDAAIALAHGLDKLVKEGVSLDKMTAGRLSEAIRNSPFEGASGKVLFEENGDRNSTNLKYTVYDYNSAEGKFVDAGQVNVDGTFTKSTEYAITFADGSTDVPDVKFMVSDDFVEY